MSRYFSKDVANLEAYVPGEQPKDRKYIKLNANESPYPASPKVAEAITRAEIDGLRLYSDSTCATLTAAIAKRYGVKPAQVIPGNGSDEVLAFAIRAFCSEDTPLAYADVTYSFYNVWAKLWRVPEKVVPLREDFTLAIDDYIGLGCTMVIANPNAPSGLALPVSEIERLLKADPDHVLIVDEAYVDFGAESCVPLVDKYPNLLVVQTCSKSRNLAGARLGFAIGSEELIADMNRIKFCYNPFNVNKLTILAGIAAMEDETYFRECTGKIMATRAWTTNALRELGFKVGDSMTNFLLAEPGHMDGKTVCAGLKERGILIRRFDGARTGKYLRISIGTQEDMEALVAALKEMGA